MLRKLVKKVIMPKQEHESTYQYFTRVSYVENKVREFMGDILGGSLIGTCISLLVIWGLLH